MKHVELDVRLSDHEGSTVAACNALMEKLCATVGRERIRTVYWATLRFSVDTPLSSLWSRARLSVDVQP